MRKNRNNFILLSAVAVSLFTLSGCRGGGGGTTTTDIATIEELQAQSSVTIRLWHSFSENIWGPTQTLINEFRELYPNVTVNAERITGGYDGLKTTLVQSLASGDIPHLTLGYPDHVAEYLNSKAVASLNPFIFSTSPGVGLSQQELDDFIPGYLAEGLVFDGENYYSLPYNKSTEAMVYNKTVFDQLGLDVPTTWDEVKTVTDAIKAAVANDTVKKKVSSTVEQPFTPTEKANMFGMTYDSSSNLFITAVRQWGGTYTVKEGTTVGTHLAFNSDETRAMLTYFQTAANGKYIGLPQSVEEGALFGSTAFKNQQTFMTIGSIAGINNNVPTDSQGALRFQIAAAPIPQKSQDTKAVIQQGTNLSMLAIGNKYQRLAAWLLIKYLTSPTPTADLAMNTGYLPVRTSAFQSDTFQAYLNPAPTASATIRARAAVAQAAYDQSAYYFVDPAFIGSSRVRSEVGLLMDAVILANKNVNLAITDTYARIGA